MTRISPYNILALPHQDQVRLSFLQSLHFKRLEQTLNQKIRLTFILAENLLRLVILIKRQIIVQNNLLLIRKNRRLLKRCSHDMLKRVRIKILLIMLVVLIEHPV